MSFAVTYLDTHRAYGLFFISFLHEIVRTRAKDERAVHVESGLRRTQRIKIHAGIQHNAPRYKALKHFAQRQWRDQSMRF